MHSPSYPDPGKTAQQQASANTGTAISSQLLNMINQNTPTGSLNYNPTGTYSYTDPTTGKITKIPSFTATTQLSPEQQKLFNQQERFDYATNKIGLDQTGRIGKLLGTPLNLNNSAVEGRLMELGRARLDPLWQQRDQQLGQQLQNRGIAAGSQAYDAAMRNESQAKNDAYNQLLLTGRGQAVNEALTQRNQPINEITALMAGGQVQQPQFVNTPSTNVANTDVAGLQNNAFQARQQQYQSMLGGLFGLGSAGIGGWASGAF